MKKFDGTTMMKGSIDDARRYSYDNFTAVRLQPEENAMNWVYFYRGKQITEEFALEHFYL